MSTLPSTPPDLRAALLRAFFIATAVASGLSVLALLANPARRGWMPALPLMAAFGALGLASLAATRLPARAAQRAMLLISLGGVATVGASAFANGFGMRAPGLALFGLACCLCMTLGNVRLGALVAGAAVLVVSGLSAAEFAGLVPDGSGISPIPLPLRLLVMLAAIGLGTAAGRQLQRLIESHLRDSQERELRFQGLLGIAAAAYWETDEQLHMRHVSLREADGRFVPVPLLPRRPPWDLPELRFDDDTVDALRADMEAREAFRDVAMTWQAPDRLARHFVISGEPQRDAGGRFIGYWGVARDTTAEHKARLALMATEQRYEELFRRMPSALVLHRQGVVLDANPAAAALFEFEDVHQLLGADLLRLQSSEEGLQQARARHEQLAQLLPGDALPPADCFITSRSGRPLVVTETPVRADTDGEATTLSIFVDRTAQQSAEKALRRSQALLSQVVTMSPDIITLTDLDTGRYEMVNDSFCRMTGYGQADVIGRTATELNVWFDPDDRERLLRAMRRRGAVENLSIAFRRRDGSRAQTLLSAAFFERDGRTWLVINARDMTDAHRTRLEREAILDNASIGIAFTRDRCFVMVNPHFEQMYGWQPGELIGQAGRVVWANDADYDSLGAEVGPPLRRGEMVEFERLATRRDGSRFMVRMRAKAIDPAHPSESGTIWIAEDITAQHQARQALARARDDAEAANRAKSAFLANTSHEIRTPLNGLVGLARLARMPNVEESRLRHYLEQIGASAETLSAIISDILDLSKIEAGKLDVEQVPFDLLELLHSLQQAYATLADSHGLAFAVDIHPRVPQLVRGDALRVRQILANYLHNALKFTARGGLRLTVAPAAGDRLRFEVHDTGSGIDAETQARLFKPFTQADESITRRFGGTGLGLSICRELAQLMGGEVGVRSRAGQGSTFFAELPLPMEHDAAAVSGHGALDDDPLHGARVLLVEDNPVNMMIAVALLEQWGARAEEAGDGPQALAAVARAEQQGRPFDVVLMDVQMPGMSGYETTRRLREHHSLVALPIIALTAAALTSERERAAEIGMNDFLTKPIDANRMRITLQRVLAARLAHPGEH